MHNLMLTFNNNAKLKIAVREADLVNARNALNDAIKSNLVAHIYDIKDDIQHNINGNKLLYYTFL